MRYVIVLLFAIVFVLTPLMSQTPAPTADQLMQAIREGSAYAMEVLLDANGKSRCDYNVIEGKWYNYEPPWHTGQLINALVEVYKLTNEEKYLAAAKKAGDWWVGLEIKDHPKLKGMVRSIHEDGIDFIVCATLTDGTPGLFNLYRVTRERKYAEVPTKAGEWMLNNLYLPEQGLFYDLVDTASGDVVKQNSVLSPKKRNQNLNDVARPNNEGYLYKDMYEYTKDERYKEVFINLCESLIEKQGPEGIWMQFAPNNAEEGTFHPRFNLWNAESLIEGYELTGKASYLEAARKTLVFYAKHQKKDGAIGYVNYLDGRTTDGGYAGSAVSFAGMLWMRLLKHGVGKEFVPNIERSVHWVLKNRFPADHPDKNLAGGFLNLRIRAKNGKVWMTQRDLGTSFGLRFLVAYYQTTYGIRK